MRVKTYFKFLNTFSNMIVLTPPCLTIKQYHGWSTLWKWQSASTTIQSGLFKVVLLRYSFKFPTKACFNIYLQNTEASVKSISATNDKKSKLVN